MIARVRRAVGWAAYFVATLLEQLGDAALEPADTSEVDLNPRRCPVCRELLRPEAPHDHGDVEVLASTRGTFVPVPRLDR